MPVISICIPTYNRSRMLAELLDSIVAQELPDDIEVIVSDDASSDDTAEIAEAYSRSIKNYTFIRQPVNLGMDRNFRAVTSAASAPYLWLMGDDDRIETGGARHVIDALRRWPDAVGLTLGVIDYDVTMRRRTGIRRMPESKLVTGAGAVFGEIIELLGFMSALVIRRDLWQAQASDPFIRSVDNNYVQVFILGKALGSEGQWGVLNEPCVGFRSGNDQLKSKLGWVDRLRIDVRAYEEIAGALFPSDPTVRASIRRRVFDNHMLSHVINAKTANEPLPGMHQATGLLLKTYYTVPSFWTKGLPAILAPRRAIRLARKYYQRLRRSGSSRAMRADRVTG